MHVSFVSRDPLGTRKGDLVGCDISVNGPDQVLKSSSDVKALTYCDLKCIHIPGLMEVLKLYPEFAQTFCSDILHDLTFNLREGYEMEDNGGTSLTLPSISEDDENNDSDGTAPASPMSPCLTINRNKYNAGTTPFRVKEDIEDVSSELGNGGERLHFLDKTSKTLCSRRVSI
ncbi:potassium voltage-gated channel subfamily H member 8 [Trichonephila clavipes]|nr:potassium voltage-gated channel subfamily H member 8 [Trichonephila clavipes]